MMPIRTLWLALLSAALSLAVPTVHAQRPDPQAKLELVRKLPYSGEWPPLTGFSPAQPVKGFNAPPGLHEHTQAYRGANGCVAFFFPLGPNSADVAFKWNGGACKGQLLEGEGELQIRRRVGETTVVAVLRGPFKGGMLTGKAGKAGKVYFRYDRAGQPLPGVTILQGDFANSVLHGEGNVRWSGAADARPSAWLREGTFKEGALQGGGVQARLRPYPGVEAEVQELLFNENGEIYIEQARLNRGNLLDGTLYFEDDPVPWGVELAVWRDDAPEAARFRRLDTTQFSVLLTACMKWRFEATQLSCERGAASSGGYSGTIGLNDAGFTVKLPARTDEVPFRPIGHPPITVALEQSEIAMRCDADLSRCTGTGVLPIERSGLYWHGDIEWRDRAMRPVKASLHERPGDGTARRDPASDTRLANCERFDDALNCSRGTTFFRSGANFSGGWTLVGAAYGGEGGNPPRYVAHDAHYPSPRGWGTFNYADGKWAEVRYNGNGRLDSVGKCDVPSVSSRVNCELDGMTVIFTPEGDGNRREARQSAPQQVYVPPSSPARFERIQIPQRPVYVLPGMR